jgi:hypothetical protein
VNDFYIIKTINYIPSLNALSAVNFTSSNGLKFLLQLSTCRSRYESRKRGGRKEKGDYGEGKYAIKK